MLSCAGSVPVSSISSEPHLQQDVSKDEDIQQCTWTVAEVRVESFEVESLKVEGLRAGVRVRGVRMSI